MADAAVHEATRHPQRHRTPELANARRRSDTAGPTTFMVDESLRLLLQNASEDRFFLARTPSVSLRQWPTLLPFPVGPI